MAGFTSQMKILSNALGLQRVFIQAAEKTSNAAPEIAIKKEKNFLKNFAYFSYLFFEDKKWITRILQVAGFLPNGSKK